MTQFALHSRTSQIGWYCKETTKYQNTMNINDFSSCWYCDNIVDHPEHRSSLLKSTKHTLKNK